MDIMFYSNQSAKYIAEYVQHHIRDTVNENRSIRHTNRDFYLNCKYYDLLVESTVNNTDSELIGIMEDVCREFCIKVNTSINVNIYWSTFSDGMNNIKKLIYELLTMFKGDALITDDSGAVVYKRSQGG